MQCESTLTIIHEWLMVPIWFVHSFNSIYMNKNCLKFINYIKVVTHWLLLNVNFKTTYTQAASSFYDFCNIVWILYDFGYTLIVITTNPLLIVYSLLRAHSPQWETVMFQFHTNFTAVRCTLCNCGTQDTLALWPNRTAHRTLNQSKNRDK